MASFHLRSISLPSISHPQILHIEEQLFKLKASQSSSIGHKLVSLKNLFECIDDFLQLPVSHLSCDRQSQRVEEALNGSLDLLDMCSTTRDLFSQMRGCVQELQLSLRRRKGGDSGLTSEVDAYMVSRKRLNKMVSKLLRNLKRKVRKCTAGSLEENSNLTNMISMLRSVEEISLEVFESILSFISHQHMSKSKTSGWSVISKLLQNKRVSNEGKVGTNEVEKIDSEMLVLKSRKDIKFLQMQNVLKELEALESSIQEVEEELEFVYRKLLKTRVSLLNMLNH